MRCCICSPEQSASPWPLTAPTSDTAFGAQQTALQSVHRRRRPFSPRRRVHPVTGVFCSCGHRSPLRFSPRPGLDRSPQCCNRTPSSSAAEVERQRGLMILCVWRACVRTCVRVFEATCGGSQFADIPLVSRLQRRERSALLQEVMGACRGERERRRIQDGGRAFLTEFLSHFPKCSALSCGFSVQLQRWPNRSCCCVPMLHQHLL